MRNILLAAAVAIIAFSGCKPEEKSTTVLQYLTPYQVAPEFLNGKLKSISENNYHAIDNDGEYVKGNLLTQDERVEQQWSNHFVASYDETGNMLKNEYPGADGTTAFWKCEFDGKNMIKASWVRNDTVRSYYELFYDDGDKITMAKHLLGSNDSLLRKWNYVTNDDGYMTEATLLDATDIKTAGYIFERDLKNLTKRYLVMSATDSLRFEDLYEYNESGFYKKVTYMNGLGEVQTLVEMEYRKFDEKGNWLEAIVTRNGEVKLVVERIYEYY